MNFNKLMTTQKGSYLLIIGGGLLMFLFFIGITRLDKIMHAQSPASAEAQATEMPFKETNWVKTNDIPGYEDRVDCFSGKQMDPRRGIVVCLPEDWKNPQLSKMELEE